MGRWGAETPPDQLTAPAPVEDLAVVFMTQLIPSGTFNFGGQLRSIVYGALL